MHMKIEWKIRVLSVFLIVSIVFLRSEELFPHNGSTHHSRFWCHVPPAVIDFWVFTEGHLHADFLTDDAGVGIFSGGFYGCERSSYNIGTSGAGNDRSNAVTNCNVEGGVIPFQSVNSAESGKSWTGIFISVHFRGTGGSPESDMAVGVHEAWSHHSSGSIDHFAVRGNRTYVSYPGYFSVFD